jgi:hypothetical protein
MRDQMFRRAVHRPSVTHEPTIPWSAGRETCGIAVWGANIRLDLAVALACVPWAITGGGVPDPASAAFLLAMAGVAGRSGVAWTRLTRF